MATNGGPTNYDILEAINSFATNTEQRFQKLETRFDTLETRFDKLETKVIAMKATMVTKDYLDEKLAGVQGHLISVIRKEDHRLTSLIKIFAQKDMLTEKEVVTLDAQKPLVSYDDRTI